MYIHILVIFIIFHRWISKSKNGVANIADDVKCRIRRIANSLTIEDMAKSIDDLKSWQFFNGKLKMWFESMNIIFSVIDHSTIN